MQTYDVTVIINYESRTYLVKKNLPVQGADESTNFQCIKQNLLGNKLLVKKKTKI